MKRTPFESKWVPEPNSGCHIWIANTSTKGYGRAWWGGRDVQAHRVAYEMARGQIPQGLVIDHICRNRLCVNPAHLRAVTTRQNVLENSVGVSAVHAKKTHCIRGHEFTPDNTRPHRGRSCRACDRQWRLMARARKLHNLIPAEMRVSRALERSKS